MVPQQVREFLDKEGAPYEVVAHPKAFTAQGVAAALHVSGWILASFNAGTHTEAIRMKYADYERLVHPVGGRLAWQR